MEVYTYQEYGILLEDIKHDIWVAKPLVTSSKQIFTAQQMAAKFISM